MMPRELHYQEGEPIPEGYHKDTKIRKGLVIGGAVTFGAVWLVTVLIGSVIVSVDEGINSGTSEYTPLFVPVVGPFITMGTANIGSAAYAPLIINGVAQAGGVAMLVAGLAAKKTVLVRNDIATDVRTAPALA